MVLLAIFQDNNHGKYKANFRELREENHRSTQNHKMLDKQEQQGCAIQIYHSPQMKSALIFDL